MQIFKNIFYTLYRIWFYILVAIPILIMFPILFLSLIKETWYPFFFKLVRIWARFILFFMGFRVKIDRKQNTEKNKSYMFIANHTSMADIMLMIVSVKKPFVFVGKKELAKIPIFGFFFKRSSILVDRDSVESRGAVFKRAQKRLNQGLSICIFPEGIVPEENILLEEFKNGAFKLAINHKIPIVPLVFYDNKKRFSYTFFSGGPGVMRVRVLKFVPTESLKMGQDMVELRNKCRLLILNELRSWVEN